MLKHLSSLLVTCILYIGSMGQVNVQDLLANIEDRPADSLLVSDLERIGTYYLEVDLDSSRLYAQRGIRIARSLDYEQGIIKHANILGNYHQRIGQADSARSYYDLVLATSKSIGDVKGKAIALNNIAILHTYSGEYPIALKLYQEALAAEELIGDETGIAEALNNIGVIHYYMEDIPKTLEYFERSTAISESIGDTAVVKKGYNNLGALYDYAKDYDKALEYYQKSYDLAEALGQKKEMGIMLNNIATAYSGKKDYDKALETYYATLEIRREMKDYQGEANTLLNIGGDLYAQGKKRAAYEQMNVGLEITERYDLKYLRSEAYERLMEYHRLDGHWEEALAYSDRLRVLKDSLLNEERVNAVAEMETRYETEQKERELLEEQSKSDQLAKEKAEAELQVNQRNTVIALGSVGILSLLFLGLFLIQRNKRRSEADKNEAVLAERDKGMQAVLEAQEEERSRISKDLHDGVGQQLSGLKMGFQVLNKKLDVDEALKGQLANLSQVIDETASDVRSISHQMMPKSLHQLGLSAAISDMLDKSLGSGGIGYSFEELNPIGRSDASLELGLYRISQELVNNIIKHANAQHVEVQLYKRKQMIILSIEDDGVGFDIDSASAGHGMLNIQQRARLIHGQLEIDSTEGKGTRVTLRVPQADE